MQTYNLSFYIQTKPTNDTKSIKTEDSELVHEDFEYFDNDIDADESQFEEGNVSMGQLTADPADDIMARVARSKLIKGFVGSIVICCVVICIIICSAI